MGVQPDSVLGLVESQNAGLQGSLVLVGREEVGDRHWLQAEPDRARQSAGAELAPEEGPVEVASLADGARPVSKPPGAAEEGFTRTPGDAG